MGHPPRKEAFKKNSHLVSLALLSTVDLMPATSSFQLDAVTLPFIPDSQKAIQPVEREHFQMVPLKENALGSPLH